MLLSSRFLTIVSVMQFMSAFDTNTLNTSFYIEDETDIEIMAKLVLMRDNIIIDPTAASEIDEAMMNLLMEKIYINQHRRHAPGGRLILPTLDHRDIGCGEQDERNIEHRIDDLCNSVTAKCLSPSDMVALLPPDRFVTMSQGLAYLCPLLLFRIARPICYAPDHHQIEKKIKVSIQEPSPEKVWGFGVLFVTLSIVVSMGGLIVLPFLNKDSRRIILTLFEGLAVGGLVGSAVIHLFPKAYNITQETFQLYFSRIFVVFGGIYMFYVLERILKILTTMKKAKNKKAHNRRRASSFGREEHLNMAPFVTRNSIASFVRESQSTLNTIEMSYQRPPNERSSSIKSAQPNSTQYQIDKCLASVKKSSSQPILSYHGVNQSKISLNQQAPTNVTETAKSVSVASKRTYVPDIAGRREDQNTAVNRLHTDSVAWMIVLGDASLNFIDGLSIGAAFDRNILAGISISVAVMLEEVPHRLGTFAVLLRAGMNMKQSFLWIFISACFLYPGLVIGAFLGDAAEDASPYIFALAGGMFLYMALVDVMKEMNNSMENALKKGFRSGLQILALQNLGVIIAIIILSVLALYERDMDFEQVEISEIMIGSVHKMKEI